MDTSGTQLDIPAVITQAVRCFDAEAMRSGVVGTLSNLSAASSDIVGKLTKHHVFNEAVYHFQLYSILYQWLGLWGYADVASEADVVTSGTPKRFANILRLKKEMDASSSPTHILQLMASADDQEVAAHYESTVEYMKAHSAAQGACIIFTAVSDAAQVSSQDTSSHLVWPTAKQLEAGLVAVHVVHDVDWTQARIYSQQLDSTLQASELIVLSPVISSDWRDESKLNAQDRSGGSLQAQCSLA
jgi:hypothetical protein